LTAKRKTVVTSKTVGNIEKSTAFFKYATVRIISTPDKMLKPINKSSIKVGIGIINIKTTTTRKTAKIIEGSFPAFKRFNKRFDPEFFLTSDTFPSPKNEFPQMYNKTFLLF